MCSRNKHVWMNFCDDYTTCNRKTKGQTKGDKPTDIENVKCTKHIRKYVIYDIKISYISTELYLNKINLLVSTIMLFQRFCR